MMDWGQGVRVVFGVGGPALSAFLGAGRWRKRDGLTGVLSGKRRKISARS